MTHELPISPASTTEYGLYLMFLARDVFLKSRLVTISQDTMENNLGVVPGTERVSLVLIWSIPVQVWRGLAVCTLGYVALSELASCAGSPMRGFPMGSMCVLYIVPVLWFVS